MLLAEIFEANWEMVVLVAIITVGIVWLLRDRASVKASLGKMQVSIQETANQVNHVEHGEPTLRQMVKDILVRMMNLEIGLEATQEHSVETRKAVVALKSDVEALQDIVR